MTAVDEAFRGAGEETGLEVWCIENLQLVPIPKSSHGKFYSGNAYIILSTVLRKNGLAHDIHYWLGKDAKEVDSAMASEKTLELDAALGSRSVQYREVQGSETDKFLSYFKPCIIPVQGVFSPEPHGVRGHSYRVSLLSCKGDHVAHVREVPFSRSSLNHDHVFILDTRSKIFLFCGCNSSMQERAKALDVVRHIKENQHGGRCEVATIEDGKFVGDFDAGEFWSFFGGHAPIPRDSSSSAQTAAKISSTKFFWINKGKLFPIDTTSMNREMLSSDNCYMLDCGAEIFIWMGRTTSVSERKTCILAVEDVIHSQGRSMSSHTIFLTEGSETAQFKSYFSGWPRTPAPNLYEEGREKVAAIFKHQGYDVKELPEDNSQPFINCNGNLRVWRVNCHGASLIPTSEQRKLYRGDCYIIQYTYPGSEKDNHIFYAWLGQNSVSEDRDDAISLMSNMVDSIKGHPVMARVLECNEPNLFFTIFKSLIIYKGGMSSAYKKSISERGITDETCDDDRTALFRVQGSGFHNMQAIQVDLVSSSLNSSYCYVLQNGASIFAWVGNLSAPTDHALLDRMLDQISPLKQPISVREGSEPDTFWNALGGKVEYPREKDIKGSNEDPRLFTLVFKEGDLKVGEIFNFTQDDLMTEDILVLDCHNEIYVWVGLQANFTSKKKAFNFGQKFLEADILQEGKSLDTTIYVITEGYEPLFFTRFFNWDTLKANMYGNSFERKLTVLKGFSLNVKTPDKGFQSFKKLANHDGSCARHGSTAFNSLAGYKDPNNHRLSNATTVARPLFTSSSPSHRTSTDLLLKTGRFSQISLSKDGSSESQSTMKELHLSSKGIEETTVEDPEGNDENDRSQTLPYELLKVPNMPAKRIDITRREAYLSNEEFEEKFGITKKAFYKLPKWKQNKLKVELSLF